MERISRAQLERLGEQLTPRDWAIIGTLGRLRLVTGGQLARMYWPGASPNDARAARRGLKRLVDWRVLGRLERRQAGIGGGSDSWTLALDIAGQRLLEFAGTARRPRVPGRGFWRHVLLVSEIYTTLVESLPATGRRLVDWQGEPDCWRDFTGSFSQHLRLKPDAFVRLEGTGFEDLFFIEADTGVQSRTVIRGKLDGYRRYVASGREQATFDGTFPQVVFITTRPARHAVLVDLVGELPAADWPLFAIGLVEDTARLLAGPEVTL